MKKIAAIMAMGLLVVALTAAPAQAGLGGCGTTVKIPSVNKSGTTSNPYFDALRWVLPGGALNILQAIQHISHGSKSEGLGGCLWGLGGCKL